MHTRKVEVGFLLSIFERNTLDKQENMAKTNYSGIIGTAWVWYSLQRLNSSPQNILEE
jgi:hypothetical protein